MTKKINFKKIFIDIADMLFFFMGVFFIYLAYGHFQGTLPEWYPLGAPGSANPANWKGYFSIVVAIVCFIESFVFFNTSMKIEEEETQ